VSGGESDEVRVLVVESEPIVSLLQVPGIDALPASPFGAEEVAEKVASLIGEKTDARADRCLSVTAALDVRRQVLCDIWRRLTAINIADRAL
jgi:hypothetical protein